MKAIESEIVVRDGIATINRRFWFNKAYRRPGVDDRYARKRYMLYVIDNMLPLLSGAVYVTDTVYGSDPTNGCMRFASLALLFPADSSG